MPVLKVQKKHNIPDGEYVIKPFIFKHISNATAAMSQTLKEHITVGMRPIKCVFISQKFELLTLITLSI